MYIIVLVTCAQKKEAQRIAEALVEKRLAACVNIIDKISSIFYWQGKIDSAKELLLVVKTKKTKLPKIIKLVKSLHSYNVPEIIAVPVISGDKNYLKWINDSIR